MSFPDHSPPFQMMSPPQFPTDAIDLSRQFPMNNNVFISSLDQAPAFKKARTGDISHTNPCPPRMNQHQPPPNPNPPTNKGTSHIFFKTRMCAKFRVGACRNGENCNFAHGLEDMRQPPPNWQELVGVRNDDRQLSENWDDDQRIIHKMKICKKYYNGEECPYGDKCTFLHEDPAKFRDDPSRIRESSAISIGTNGSPPKSFGDNGCNNSESNNRVVNTGVNVLRGNARSTYWKTKLCIKWENTGHCPFGDNCHFAHGQAELQLPGGGHIEPATAGAIVNASRAIMTPTLPMVMPFSANDAPSNYTASLPPATEEEKGQKYFSKWKGPKKINLIYGDWIDDLPLVNSLSSKVET